MNVLRYLTEEEPNVIMAKYKPFKGDNRVDQDVYATLSTPRGVDLSLNLSLWALPSIHIKVTIMLSDHV